MKRGIALLLVLSGILFTFGCNQTADETESDDLTQNTDEAEMNEFHYNVQVCGYSDSVSEAEYSLEFSRWYMSSYEKTNLKGKTFEWTKSDISLKGTYAESNVRTNEYYERHCFEGDDISFFETDENGKVVHFYLGYERMDLTESSLSQEQCVEIAEEFFSQMVENEEDYTVTSEYSDYYKHYQIVFTKYIDSWETADQAVIMVNPNTGKISSYNATMIERMDVNAKPNLDKAKLDAVVTEKLDKIFGKAKEKYDQVNYGEHSYVLTKVSEKEYAVVCEVQVDCVEEAGEYNIIISELMRFVIT